MKRIEIITFACSLALIMFGTLLTAEDEQITQKQMREITENANPQVLPRGQLVLTAGGITGTPGSLNINGCKVTATPDKDACKQGEDMVITVTIENPTDESRTVEFYLDVQSMIYDRFSRMPSPPRIKRLARQDVCMNVTPGENATKSITFQKFRKNALPEFLYVVAHEKIVAGSSDKSKAAAGGQLAAQMRGVPDAAIYLCCFSVGNPEKPATANLMMKTSD